MFVFYPLAVATQPTHFFFKFYNSYLSLYCDYINDVIIPFSQSRNKVSWWKRKFHGFLYAPLKLLLFQSLSGNVCWCYYTERNFATTRTSENEHTSMTHLSVWIHTTATRVVHTLCWNVSIQIRSTAPDEILRQISTCYVTSTCKFRPLLCSPTHSVTVHNLKRTQSKSIDCLTTERDYYTLSIQRFFQRFSKIYLML